MKTILQIIRALVAVFILVAFASWGIRNPTANEMTFLTHFWDVVRFQKLEQFQGIQ